MATQTLRLSTTSLGALTAVTFSAALSTADIASISNGISDDQAILSTSKGPAATALYGGVVLTGQTTTTLTTITGVSISAPSGAAITGITAGQYLYGFGLAPGTRVLTTPAAGATTITMDQAPLTGQTSGSFIAVGSRTNAAGAFATGGFLNVPNRGVLKVLPGDVIATGPSGEVILLPSLAINWAGSPWIVA